MLMAPYTDTDTWKSLLLYFHNTSKQNENTQNKTNSTLLSNLCALNGNDIFMVQREEKSNNKNNSNKNGCNYYNNNNNDNR